MNANTRNAYVEVVTIIDLLEEDFKNKVPKKLVEFFKTEKSENYIIEINPNIPLEEQKLLKETIDILAMLKLNYWCSNEEEKQELLDLLNENEKIYQKEVQEKYNPDNLFKNRNKKIEEVQTSETAIVEYKKPNFIIAILNKIKDLFRKKN